MNHDSHKRNRTQRTIAWCTSIGCVTLGSLAAYDTVAAHGPSSLGVAVMVPESQRFKGPPLLVAHATFEPSEKVVMKAAAYAEVVDAESQLVTPVPSPPVQIAYSPAEPAFHSGANTAGRPELSIPGPYDTVESTNETRSPPAKAPPPAPKTLQGTIGVEGRIANGVSFGIEQDGTWEWHYLGQGGFYNTRMVPWVSGRVALVPGVKHNGEKLPADYFWLKPYRRGSGLKLDVTP